MEKEQLYLFAQHYFGLFLQVPQVLADAVIL